MYLKGRNIFIVEDNAGNLAIMNTFLQKEGARVGFSRWGNEFLNRLLPFLPVDLILLDLALSDNTNGYEVFRQMRQIDFLQHVPIALVSAADPDIEMHKAREMGFIGFIAKPVRPNFPYLVQSLLNGKAVWGDSLEYPFDY